MFRRFSFWINAAAIMQLLSALLHSLSFFAPAVPQNDTEKLLLDVTTNYHPDAGMGFHPSFMQLFTGLSICFALLCLFGACINWYFKKKKLSIDLWKGLLLLEIVFFGLLFITMLLFTFPPPIICTLIIFICVCGAYFTRRNQAV